MKPFFAPKRDPQRRCVLQKFLFTSVTASALLSATVAFAQAGAGFTPAMYGTKAFDTNRQQSPNMTSEQKGSGQPQLEKGSVSEKVAPAQSHKTPG
jgi:hypothetical protein